MPEHEPPGFRDTDDESECCVQCKHFRSYKSIYEDELEPWDCGKCGYAAGFDEQVSYDTVCDLRESTGC